MFSAHLYLRNKHIIMSVVSFLLLKIGNITDSFIWTLSFFEVEENTGKLRNSSRNSHSRRSYMHTYTYRIPLQNTLMKYWTQAPLQILWWSKLHVSRFHFVWSTKIKKKKISLAVYLYLNWCFWYLFACRILIYSAYLQHSVEDATSGGISILLTFLTFDFWFMSLPYNST